jgi:carboxyl-terminal processing protease
MSLITLVCLACAVQARHQRNLGDLGFAMDLIEHGYVESVDRYQLYQAAMAGMVGTLDENSGYIEPEQYGSFQSQIHQEFGGLGIVIERPAEGEPLRIFTVLYDSPAYKAGLQAGDVIEQIDGRATRRMATDDASRLLRGPPGTEVLLTVQRESSPRPLSLCIERAVIETESVTGDRRQADGRWAFMMQAEPSVAYLRLEIFGEKTPLEMKAALAAVRTEAKALIIDLRDNAGGLLPSATEICDMFLEEGQIVSTRGRRQSFASSHDATSGVDIEATLPIVILMNEMSASASEVMAACLQDHRRAKVLGERSFGKGSVQNVIDMEGGKAALRLTSAYYFPPSGRNIHKRPKATEADDWGVHPDPGLKVTLNDEQKKAVFERLRRRGQPASPELSPEAAADAGGAPAKVSPFLKRDPSLSKDPQLLRAVEYLGERLTASPLRPTGTTQP